MNDEIMSLVSEWDGMAVVVKFDRETGTWIFIALHSDALGRAVGGCRTKSYPSPAAGLKDAMRLAQGMTNKWAAAGLPVGGGKVVLALSEDLKGASRAGLFRRVGRLIEGLKGAFGTGMDLGTGPEDIINIARETRWVHGVSADGKSVTDPGPFTAAGVLAATRAALKRATGDETLREKAVLVQGLGDVGAPLARMLFEAGARVLLSDLDEGRAVALAAELKAEVVPPHVVYSIHCDVYAPCAVGATLNENTIPQLNCVAVVGSANNQLERIEDADLLHGRGILYAPDYVTNSGGAVAYFSLGSGANENQAMEKVAGIGTRLEKIFSEAALRDESRFTRQNELPARRWPGPSIFG